jgi:hypothetical protein
VALDLFLLAKRTESEEEYLALFGTISMIGNGIELLAYEKMKSGKMGSVEIPQNRKPNT